MPPNQQKIRLVTRSTRNDNTHSFEGTNNQIDTRAEALWPSSTASVSSIIVRFRMASARGGVLTAGLFSSLVSFPYMWKTRT